MKGRGIRRLCHFTPIENLPSVFSRGGVYSVESARRSAISLRRMDRSRRDGKLDHVSLSLEYPNAFLMRSYGHVAVPNRPSERHVPIAVLDIDPYVLDWTDAQYSPTNAAAGSGEYLETGIEHFRTLFAKTAPNPKCPPRSDEHPRSCPTDIQAEVMIAREIAATAIRGIYVERQVDVLRVTEMGLPAPVVAWPIIFDSDGLSTAIAEGNPPQSPLRESRPLQ